MIQGNNGTFTHKGSQAYAFGFASALNTAVFAARGGIVSFVRSDQTGNSYSNPECQGCLPNAVVTAHQDGTQTTYLHFPQNGVLPSKSGHVSRGMQIGVVGNTGYSTGPHIHIQVNPIGAPNSMLFRQQLMLSDQGAIQDCYVLVKGQPVWSTN